MATRQIDVRLRADTTRFEQDMRRAADTTRSFGRTAAQSAPLFQRVTAALASAAQQGAEGLGLSEAVRVGDLLRTREAELAVRALASQLRLLSSLAPGTEVFARATDNAERLRRSAVRATGGVEQLEAALARFGAMTQETGAFEPQIVTQLRDALPRLGRSYEDILAQQRAFVREFGDARANVDLFEVAAREPATRARQLLGTEFFAQERGRFERALSGAVRATVEVFDRFGNEAGRAYVQAIQRVFEQGVDDVAIRRQLEGLTRNIEVRLAVPEIDAPTRPVTVPVVGRFELESIDTADIRLSVLRELRSVEGPITDAGTAARGLRDALAGVASVSGGVAERAVQLDALLQDGGWVARLAASSGVAADAVARVRERLAELVASGALSPDNAERLLEFVDGAGRSYSRLAGFAQRAATSIVNSFADGIVQAERFTDVLREVAQALLRLAAQAFIAAPLSDFLGGLVGRARGGTVIGGRGYLIGEAGPEVFVPRVSGTIIPNEAIGGGGGVTVNVTGVQDPETVIAAVRNVAVPEIQAARGDARTLRRQGLIS